MASTSNFKYTTYQVSPGQWEAYADRESKVSYTRKNSSRGMMMIVLPSSLYQQLRQILYPGETLARIKWSKIKDSGLGLLRIEIFKTWAETNNNLSQGTRAVEEKH